MVSAFHDVSEKLALMANVGWEQWSRFGRVDIGIVDNTARNLTVDLDSKNTAIHVVSLNMNYKF